MVITRADQNKAEELIMNFLVSHFKNGTYFSLLIYLNCEILVAQLCPTLLIPWTVACQTPLPRNSPRNNTGVGSHFLFQGIFLTQESNRGLLHCRRILHQLSHRGIPILVQVTVISHQNYRS